MKTLVSFFIVVTFLIQATVARPQTDKRPVPGFSLTISERHRSEMPDSHLVVIRLTNISSEIYSGDNCLSERGNYNMIVLLNGEPAEETDEMRNLRKSRKDLCEGSMTNRKTKPGEYREDEFDASGYFDMSRSGTYQITVTKETDPDHPEKSVTVKSNTITIVVPESEAVAPK
jgi:hypothetical protein